MALTPAQLIAAILHGNTMELALDATPANQVTILDVENYASLGLVAGTDTAESLLKIISPINTPVYENDGFATDDYSAPDFEFLVSPVNSITKELPSVTANPNQVIAGTYTVYVKQKVVQGADTFEVEKTLYFVICSELTARYASLASTYDCDSGPATFTVTDETSMAGAGGFVFDSVEREITISPPFGSGLSPTTGSASPFTQSPLWTGTYGFSIEGFITFKKGVDTIILRYSLNGEKLVICNDVLCKIYCCLTHLRDDYYAEKNESKKEILWNRLMLGLLEYQLAVRARLCGFGGSVAGYVSKFYEVTGCNPDCDCCEQDAVSPVTSDCGCSNGSDGREIELRANGDMVQWRYVGDLAWNDLFDVSDIQGPTGPEGPAGASIIHNGFTDVSTTGIAAYETLDTTSVSAALVGANKDALHIHAVFTCGNSLTNNTNLNQECRVMVNGQVVCLGTFVFDNLNVIEMDIFLTRMSDTTARAEYTITSYQNTAIGNLLLPSGVVENMINITGLDFGVLQNIVAQGKTQVGETVQVTSKTLRVLYLRYGAGSPTGSGVQYIVPFTTTNGTTIYPAIIGATGKDMLRIYLDGVLLKSSDWSYDNITDVLTFLISITGASEVAGDYT